MRNKMNGIIPQIAPSILSADFSHLADEMESIGGSGADMVHLDVMDGHFVPNLTFGPPVIQALRKYSTLSFDVHLMIEAPERWLKSYRDVGSDRITFHLEACHHSQRHLAYIKELGAISGISLNPQTCIAGLEYLLPVCDQILIMSVNPGFGGQVFLEEVLPKIVAVRRLIDTLGLSTVIQVDGGVDRKNARRILEAGADVLIMGSAFFKEADRKGLVQEIKNLRIDRG